MSHLDHKHFLVPQPPKPTRSEVQAALNRISMGAGLPSYSELEHRVAVLEQEVQAARVALDQLKTAP